MSVLASYIDSPTDALFSRDSDDGHEQSESPSPVDRVNRVRSVMGEDSSALSQAPFSSSPPTGFFNQSASYSENAHHQADMHTGISPPSSRNYYAHGVDQTLSSPTSPWHTGTYNPFQPSSPTEASVGSPYSPHSPHPALSHSASEDSPWELRGMDVPRARGSAATNWSPDSRSILEQPIASLGLRAQTPSMPIARTAASSWSWDGHGSDVAFPPSSHRDHSHRSSVHRSSYSSNPNHVYGTHS